MLWIGFVALIGILVAIDLGVFHRKDAEISLKSSLIWTIFWIFLAMLFNAVVYYLYQYNPHHYLGNYTPTDHAGWTASINFLTGYIIEKSLSLDNVFVFALVFSYFKIPTKYQHKVLFWGILGAVVFRGVLILCGVYFIQKFQILTVLLGVFILYTAAKMMVDKHDNFKPENNPIIKWLRKRNLISTGEVSGNFFEVVNGRRLVTTLFVTMIIIELSDIAFAVDSIPAIFAVTSDPFIILTSNIFAIFGLRSLYFVLASSLTQLRYLKQSLIFILIFIGMKMGLSQLVHIPTTATLMFIIAALATGIVASLLTTPETDVDIPKAELDLHGFEGLRPRKWGRTLLIAIIFVIIILIGLILFKSGSLTSPFGWS